MGLKFCNEAIIALQQIWPKSEPERSFAHSSLQVNGNFIWKFIQSSKNVALNFDVTLSDLLFYYVNLIMWNDFQIWLERFKVAYWKFWPFRVNKLTYFVVVVIICCGRSYCCHQFIWYQRESSAGFQRLNIFLCNSKQHKNELSTKLRCTFLTIFKSQLSSSFSAV